MSVQLVLYPQNYNGFFFDLSGAPTTEFVADYINFTTINTTTSYDVASTMGATIIAGAGGGNVNVWYKWRYPDTGSQPTLPTQKSNNLTLYGIAGGAGQTGVFQKLSGLIVGVNYVVTVVTTTPGSVDGVLTLQVFDDVSLVTATSSTVTGATITLNFTATSANNIIFLKYERVSSTGSDIINSISVTGKGFSPSGSRVDLTDGQVICDLYEDEDIPLTLSVDNFTNVAEKPQSYSKAFKLPATKRNNQIFDNIFEITRSSEGNVLFNPYVKTRCVLKQDGFILFDGYLRLINIDDKDHEISYNVNIYSEVVALADILKERELSVLNFSELDHLYNFANIQYSWNNTGTGIGYTNPNTSGFRDANDTVKYPFVDWNHQWAVGGSGWNGDAATGMPEMERLSTAFRPFIQIRYLVDRIFQNTPFTFTSTFFDSALFKNLYMDFNWGEGNSPTMVNTNTSIGFFDDQNASYPVNLGTSYSAVILNPSALSASIVSSYPANYDQATNIITATQDYETYRLQYKLVYTNVAGTTHAVTTRVLHTTAAGVAQPDINLMSLTFGNFTQTIQNGDVTVTLMTGDTLQIQQKASTASGIQQYPSTIAGVNSQYGAFRVIFKESLLNVTSGALLSSARGDLKQWEFLKGLITMFNLVTIPDKSNPNNIIIETYQDTFFGTSAAQLAEKGTTLNNRGITHDWTDKIDVSQMKLEPLTELNKNTIFKYVEDDDDFAFNHYKNSTSGFLYGSKTWDAALTALGLETLLEGEEEIEAEPFAATVIKPLMSQFPELIVPSIYSYDADSGSSEGFDNAPRIMFNNGKKTLSSTTYFVPPKNFIAFSNESDFLQFSHLSAVPAVGGSSATNDLNFGACQLFPGVGATPANLFELYWMPYFAELYNPDTRILTIKVKLTAGDINRFNFSDRVFIKNRSFRVNKIDYKPNDLATVEFILIP